ncbi:Endonuclease G, mitochondrial [Halotydeus destructor]|nr:Endonuclease G, mitochondrial [Halotydeus destructor]
MSFRRVISIGAASLVGCVAGMQFERNKNLLSPKLMVVEAAAPVPAIAGDEPKLMIADKSERVKTIMQHGYPSLDTIRMYDNFVLSYDRRNRTANWVLEHLSPELLRITDKSTDRSKCDFVEDVSVHEYWRPKNDDYRGSGFDRGHLAAAGNHKVSQKHVEQTFVLSNISPQVGKGFNRDAWNNLERYVRYRAKASKNLWVCTGPVYLPKFEDGKKYVKYQVIGQNLVAVPTHFFKIMLIENNDETLEIESYLMPNQVIQTALPLLTFQVPPDSIERAAGLLFFHQIPKSKVKQINGNNKFLDKFTKNARRPNDVRSS